MIDLEVLRNEIVENHNGFDSEVIESLKLYEAYRAICNAFEDNINALLTDKDEGKYREGLLNASRELSSSKKTDL